MVDSPLISVIVPAFNSGKSIGRCLASVLANAISLEIIVVDDGSTDSTAEIVARLASNNPSIVCFSQRNAGVSSARNRGLSLARGEWVTFLDADDVLLGDMGLFYERCLAYTEAESVYFPFAASFGGFADTVHPCSGEIVAVSKSEMLLDAIGAIERRVKPYRASTVWGHFYKRDMIATNGLQFVEGMRCGEDALFNVFALNASNGVVGCDGLLYGYLLSSESATSRYAPDGAQSSMRDMETFGEAVGRLARLMPDGMEALAERNLMYMARACHIDLANPANKRGYLERRREYRDEVARRRSVALSDLVICGDWPGYWRAMARLLKVGAFLPIDALERARVLYGKLKRGSR